MFGIVPWVKAFVLTLVVEGPVVFLLLRPREGRPWRLLALFFFANLSTHPSVWFVFPELPLSPWVSFGLSEVFAAAAEAFFYRLVVRGLSWKRAWVASLLANGLSLGIGFLLYRVAIAWMF